MNPIRSILVHLDAGPHGAPRLQVARALADRFGAAVTALYAVTPAYAQMGTDVFGGSGFEALLAHDSERLASARKLVDAVDGGAAPKMQWREVQEASETAFVREALYADLLVLGQYDREHPVTGVRPDFVQSVVMASGRPALVVPYIAHTAPRFDTVLVAWKETREAARALAAAMPWLRLAKTAHVAVDDAVADTAALRQHLQRHGIEAQCHTLATRTSGAGEMLLSMASDVDADLMVMG